MAKLIGRKYYHWDRGDMTVVAADSATVVLQVKSTGTTLTVPINYLDDLIPMMSTATKLAWVALVLAACGTAYVLLTP